MAHPAFKIDRVFRLLTRSSSISCAFCDAAPDPATGKYFCGGLHQGIPSTNCCKVIRVCERYNGPLVEVFYVGTLTEYSVLHPAVSSPVVGIVDSVQPDGTGMFPVQWDVCATEPEWPVWQSKQKGPHKCNCSKQQLLRNGCKCGGI